MKDFLLSLIAKYNKEALRKKKNFSLWNAINKNYHHYKLVVIPTLKT